MSGATVWNASAYGPPPPSANVKAANALVKLGGPKRKTRKLRKTRKTRKSRKTRHRR